MERIAIVGLSCLLPGARTPDELWDALENGKDLRRKATLEEMGASPEDYFSPEKGVADTWYDYRGGYVGEFSPDLSGLPVPENELKGLDPVALWPLHAAKNALFDAGIRPGDPALSRCGFVCGNLSFPTRSSNRIFLPMYHKAVEEGLRRGTDSPDFRLPPFSQSLETSWENGIISSLPAMVATRALGLSGPCLCLDAACASTHYAIALGSLFLQTGRANMVLAGGVSAADPFFVTMGFSIFQALPGLKKSCLPFSKKSGGLFPGEGAGFFVLKRLSDAKRDGDRIHAVIEGAGLSNDGRGSSVLSPNTRGQALALKRAWEAGCVNPHEISFIECHATGTPLGDRVELETIDRLYRGQEERPLLGSAKSNFGHLLTAAGVPGVMKAVFAMRKGEIPGTFGLNEPADGLFGPDRFPAKTVPWPERGRERLAGVSAFGFGGTDAHLVLSLSGNTTKKEDALPAREPLAIVGMDVHFGPAQNLGEFLRMLETGSQCFTPLPKGRWKGLENNLALMNEIGPDGPESVKGSFITDFDADFLRYKIPPNPDDRLICQQVLAMKTADGALSDAGVKEGSNTAVIIGMETELSIHRFRGRVNLKTQLAGNGEELPDGLVAASKDSIHNAAGVNQYTSFIGNIMAARVAALWDFSGPAFTVSAGENSFFRALETAWAILSDKSVTAACVGAVDLAAGPEHVLWRAQKNPVNKGAATLSFDESVNGWIPGEGAGAVVVKRLSDAVKAGDRIYSVMEAVEFFRGTDSGAVAEAARKALDAAGASPEKIGAVEAFASGIAQEDQEETKGLFDAYRGAGSLEISISGAKANIGHTFAASGAAGLVKSALGLFHRAFYGAPNWKEPKEPEAWKGSPFFIPTQTRPWFSSSENPVRRAAISGMGLDGFSCHAVLREPLESERNPAGKMRGKTLSHRRRPLETGVFLIPLCGNDAKDVLSALSAFKKALLDGGELKKLAREAFETSRKTPDADFALVLAGKSREELASQAQAAKSAVERAFISGLDWASPQGSCFSSRPVGRTGKTAIVFPGAFNSYPAMGGDLFNLHPQLFEDLIYPKERLGELFADRLVYPRSVAALSEKELANGLSAFLENPISAFESGILFGMAATDVLRNRLGVKPSVALGYSMGEVTMMYAFSVWERGCAMSDRLRVSTVFRTDLAGPMTTIRRAFGLGPEKSTGEKIWSAFNLKATASDLLAAIGEANFAPGAPACFHTFTNTPYETAIAGHPLACEKIIRRLGCEAFESPMGDALHCEPVRADFDEMTRLHTLAVRPVEGVTFYTATTFSPLALESEAIARNIAEIYCRAVDFVRLVEKAYDDGVRVFIETGPRENLTGHIREILGPRPHLAVNLDRKGADFGASLAKASARLFSHRAEIDLSAFFGEAPAPSSKKSLVLSLTTTGADISETVEKAARAMIPEKPAPAPISTPKPENRPVPRIETSEDPNFSAGKKAAMKTEPQSAVIPQPPVPPASASPKNTATQTYPAPQVSPLNGLPPKFVENIGLAASVHVNFLDRQRQAALDVARLVSTATRRYGESLEAGLPKAAAMDAPENPPAPSPVLPARSPAKKAVWDEADLLEFAGGKIANVFGPEYAVIDTYPRQVRLPLPPYLLVSRVTGIDAKRGEFRPSHMTTEYDIPENAWYAIDGQVPWAVCVESGQCDLLLISYLGIDFECRGERVYRLLDCTLTFSGELPREGSTLRYDISIDSFARSGNNLLFFFRYNCFADDLPILTMRGGCAGFFSDGELAAGKGIIATEAEISARKKIVKVRFPPLLECPKRSFSRDDLVSIIKGDVAACFGENYRQDGRNPSLRFAASDMLMADRVVSVDPTGGAWGLGEIVAEKDLSPDHWYFPCHFKNDPVMAGSLMAEGCVQLLQFYTLFLGFQTKTADARFQPVADLPQKVRCRGQVIPKDSLLTYKVEVKRLGLDPEPFAVADVSILLGDKIVVDFTDLGVRLVEKRPDDPWKAGISAKIAAAPIFSAPVPPKKPVFTQAHLTEFAVGSLAKCFGKSFEIYENRQPPRTPNGELQLISRVMEVTGTPGDFKKPATVISEYDAPENAWFAQQSAWPGTAPYSVLMEVALQPCGFVSTWMETTQITPATDFFFRNLDGEGRLLREPDLRSKTITNESRLLTTAAAGGSIIQKFTFLLSESGSPFYEGTAVFGYFTKDALVNQVGLDQGADNNPLSTRRYLPETGAEVFDLTSPETIRRYYSPSPDKPHYCGNGPMLRFLDRVTLAPDGGKFGLGYLVAEKLVNAKDWFFPCHFHNDPVMPGSLGVEAILEIIRLFALRSGIGANFKNPRFRHGENIVKWKYRGQITPANRAMTIDVHIKKIERGEGNITVKADASLWKDKIRIYEITDAALVVEEGFE
ncbi:MAG: hypothetical protein HZB23_06945 [Deltaproteobacteria bacterium]|nr:hypothetical protein [Deltaproteobacteria bacterium]